MSWVLMASDDVCLTAYHQPTSQLGTACRSDNKARASPFLPPVCFVLQFWYGGAAGPMHGSNFKFYANFADAPMNLNPDEYVTSVTMQQVCTPASRDAMFCALSG